MLKAVFYQCKSDIGIYNLDFNFNFKKLIFFSKRERIKINIMNN